MKVLYLTSYGGRNGGGLFTTMTSILPLLQKNGVDIELMCYNDNDTEELRNYYPGIAITQYSKSKIPFLKQYGYSSELLKKIEKSQPDIIHLQGMWLYYSYAAYLYIKKHPECKLIIQPHGMLDEWAIKNSNLKKKIAGILYENKSLAAANCIHALCRREYNSIRTYGVTSPIFILPNGINTTSQLELNNKDFKQKKTLLYIGRIHPKKGLTEFVDALGFIKHSHPYFFDKWNIRIAGWNQQNFQEVLERKIAHYDISENVKFVGPVFGKEKNQELMTADAFILPSHSEGLPMTILEAWSYSLPVLMTEYCNLPEGYDSKAALKIEPTVMSISNGLLKLNGLSDIELENIGRNGRLLVEEKFQWETIADQTKALYDYLLGKASRPDFLYEN